MEEGSRAPLPLACRSPRRAEGPAGDLPSGATVAWTWRLDLDPQAAQLPLPGDGEHAEGGGCFGRSCVRVSAQLALPSLELEDPAESESEGKGVRGDICRPNR